MAKREKKANSGRAYLIAAIVFAFVMLMNMGMLYFNYNQADTNFTNTSTMMNLLNSSHGQINSINEQVVEMIAGIGEMRAHAGQCQALFPEIQGRLDTYEHLETDPLALRRFKYTRAYIDAYQNKVLEYMETALQVYLKCQQSETKDMTEFNEFIADFKNVYNEEIAPLYTAQSEMTTSTINIASRLASIRTNNVTNNMFVLITVLLFILIAGEIGIIFAARFSKRANDEISRKSAQFAEASSKLMRSREKMEDIAVSNILTGLKNRYALEQDIGERLANEQFNIAVFDLDNFRSINDTYGYDFGDEYLAQIAERLKTEFEQFADIYNITGNEFCFVFNRTVSDTQVIRIIDNIVQVMTAPYTIMNLTVQLTVSGSTYHYMAGDCLNVNSLLVKLDNVMRNAKRAGGGQIHQVTSI